MLVFLSWSGKRSRVVARELQQWLQEVIQAVEPWMSSDIEKGKKWIEELNERLEKSKVGILCLTAESLNSNWLHYEAGALAKTKDALVCSLLIDVLPSEIEYPLAQFQQTKIDKDDFRNLVHTINKAILGYGERGLTEGVLDRLFERNWERLAAALQAAKDIPPDGELLLEGQNSFSTPPESLDMMEEILGVTLLSRGKDPWTVEDLVPPVLASLSANAEPQPPAILAALAGQFEKRHLPKLMRMGLLEQASERYFLTEAGVNYFQRIAKRVQTFQEGISRFAEAKSKA